MTCDIVYLAKNRREFTEASFAALLRNTDWSLVRRLIAYDDGSTDGTLEYLEQHCPNLVRTHLGSPVAVMQHYLSNDPADIWAKIDNDTVVPPGWLSECLGVMDRSPELELLGIEAVQPCGDGERSFVPAKYIGGIGVFRTSAWQSPRSEMVPQGRFGFTSWQDQQCLTAGWIDPALRVILLDRLPHEPWLSYSADYVDRGWQRPWAKYSEGYSYLWDWWTD